MASFLFKKWHRLAEQILTEAQTQADDLRQRVEIELANRQRVEEKRLNDRALKLDERLREVERGSVLVEKREEAITARETALIERENRVGAEVERLATLTPDEARAQLLTNIDETLVAEKAKRIAKMQSEAESTASDVAKKLVATALQRVAASVAAETTVTTLHLASDEMKGRIIGREGRNIRALEGLTGVNLVVDDSPATVVISCFCPIRKQVAQTALKALLADGRIHPSTIEQAVAQAKESTQEAIVQRGTAGALQAGVHGLHREIIQLLGNLSFRTSYGQNLLTHSLEVSSLLGTMAAELGLDEQLGRRIGLLHDMGKAVAHEMEGTHALIGRDLALRYGEKEAVANGIGCHHEEIAPLTLEGSLCGLADALSASRLGARQEAVEHYVKRVQKLEAIALTFAGVQQAYALQAGRELRLMVEPKSVDDQALQVLTRDVALKIERELSYPGKIKVVALRQRHAISYAI